MSAITHFGLKDDDFEALPIYEPSPLPTYKPTGYITYFGLVNHAQLEKAREQFEQALAELRKDPTNPMLLADYTTLSKEYSSITSALAAIPDNLQKQGDGIIRRM